MRGGPRPAGAGGGGGQQHPGADPGRGGPVRPAGLPGGGLRRLLHLHGAARLRAQLLGGLRGADRPKGAEAEFSDMSVIPKGVWEPWGLYRKPLSERTVAENLKIWHAGALRREKTELPFSDLIQSEKTPQNERRIAPHPSIKPQTFMRKIVYASLPFGTGIVLDPFAGSGSTLAAATFWGYESIGVEKDKMFFDLAKEAIPKLADLYADQISFL